MCNWLDIKTAPLDGTYVLIYDRGVSIAYYDADGDYWCPEYGDEFNLERYPTHWMPLPAAPV